MRVDMFSGLIVTVYRADNQTALQSEFERLAICGLEPGVLATVRAHDGYAPYLAVRRLKEALPHARFVGAAGIMGEARFVKSTEEIAFLRKR
jgi:Xaa-Pro aminopeptidase